MKLTLHRYWPSAACTIGQLFVDGVPECYVLEDVVREAEGQPVASWKIPGETAIPRGTYKVVITWSPHFQCMLPLLVDVPGYEGVRMHPGNKAADTDGCLLTGTGRGVDVIAHSRDAFNALMPKLEAAAASGDTITIEVA